MAKYYHIEDAQWIYLDNKKVAGIDFNVEENKFQVYYPNKRSYFFYKKDITKLIKLNHNYFNELKEIFREEINEQKRNSKLN